MADPLLSTLIAHEKPFLALSIASLLEGEGFCIVGTAPSVADIMALPANAAPELGILGCHEESIGLICAALRERFPRIRLALLDTGNAADLVKVARAQRLEGCLSLDLAPDLIVSGLRLVRAGTRCYPQTDRLAANDADLPHERPVTLTPRENAVLSLIGKGQSNKLIARNLDISESTVKAHLNSVLRKTGTSNRTQAARWAFDHGQVA